MSQPDDPGQRGEHGAPGPASEPPQHDPAQPFAPGTSAQQPSQWESPQPSGWEPQQPGPQQQAPHQQGQHQQNQNPPGQYQQGQYQQGPGPQPPQAPYGGSPYPPATMPGPPMPYPPQPRPRSDYAPWGKRVGAYLIDNIPGLVLSVVAMIWYIGFIGSMVSALQRGDAYEPDLGSMGAWLIAIFVLWLLALGWAIYNRWITAGRTGQSLGKRVTKIKLISEQTGQPIGAGYAFLRDIVHYLDGIAYIGFLWPLWDEKRQTFADKLMQTVVVDHPDLPSSH